MITIIDYGMGNLGSVANMIKKVGGKSLITSNIEEIKKAKKILLPGVGSFDNAMENLEKLELIDILKDKVLNQKTPIIGICLGMQLLTRGSDEGNLEGFGFVDAFTHKFKFEDNNLKVPHMGWNRVKLEKKSKLFEGMGEQENRFYFVHSFAVGCQEKEDVLTTTSYGYSFVASFEKENIIGVQFHPEKSHKFGMRLFKNFVERY